MIINSVGLLISHGLPEKEFHAMRLWVEEKMFSLLYFKIPASRKMVNPSIQVLFLIVFSLL